MTRVSSPADEIARIRRRFVTLTALRWLPTGFAVPVMVLLLRERGLDLATVGLTVAAYSAATVLLELPTGGLADVIGRRPVLIAAALLSAAGSATVALATSAWVVMAAFVVLGAARALDSGPLQAWFVDATHGIDREASLRTGLSRAGVAESLALAAGALGAGALAAWAPLPSTGAPLIALSAPFLVAAALTCGQAILVAAWVRDPARESTGGHSDREGTMHALARTLRGGLALARDSRPIRRILILTAALGAALSGIELLAPARFATLLGGESAAAGPYAVLVTAGFLGSATGAALAPAAARMLRHPARAALVGVLGAAALLAAVAAPTFAAAAAAFVGFYLMLGLGMPLMEELTHAAADTDRRATVLSISSMALQGSAIVATTGLGVLAGATTAATALAVPALVLACGALALSRWPGDGPRPGAAATDAADVTPQPTRA